MLPVVERVLIKTAVIYFCCWQLKADVIVKEQRAGEITWTSLSKYAHDYAIPEVQSFLGRLVLPRNKVVLHLLVVLTVWSCS